MKEKFPKSFKSDEQNFSFVEKLNSEELLLRMLCTNGVGSISPIMRDLENKKSKLLKKEPWCKRGFGALSKMFGRTLYSIIRAVKPELVVETGVASGVSSSYILSALYENKKGKLISVDIEPKVGELVDNRLRHLWDLHIGKSQDILPTLDIKKIDIFFHDSDHSYKNMIWEFEWCYPKLDIGDIIISDDISWNNSIFDFARKKNEKIFFLRTSSRRSKAGVIVKGFKQDDSIYNRTTLEDVFG